MPTVHYLPGIPNKATHEFAHVFYLKEIEKKINKLSENRIGQNFLQKYGKNHNGFDEYLSNTELNLEIILASQKIQSIERKSTLLISYNQNDANLLLL
ncbi:hypothetical protein [Candidatus Protochlamydia amoebophila]|uniref:Uncharacterized protein n=1 Tax=Protochlamydia amoebophila (strain UWE25) TaxID=264201 RepID=Q6MAX3_PARUW|nr:hypothetical protein [Candidatus Protochlamydia amoebophila]CAF24276.1 unnamed protein product [Candidatus Protochlamydia amoebophila UWE25]